MADNDNGSLSYQAGKNFVWLTAAQFATRLLGAGFYFFLSHKLLDIGLGQYSFISSFVPMWFLVIDFGASSYLYREWTKGQHTPAQAARDYNVLFGFTSIVTIVVFMVFLVFNYFLNRDIYASLVLFFLTMYIAGFVHISDLYLQSSNHFRQTAIRQTLEKLTVIILGVALLMWQPKVYWVFLAILFSQVVSYGYYVWKGLTLKLAPVWDWPRIKVLVKNGLPFLFLGVFTSIYARIDTVMLRYMDNFAVVGWYGAAYKFLDIAMLFSTLFMSATFPILSQLSIGSEKKQQFNDFFQKCLRIFFSSSVLIALAFIFAAPLLFNIFFSSSFGPSVLALRILIIAQVMAFMSLLFYNLIIIKNREKVSLFIVIACALINIGLNFLLIPKYSLYGAAWATAIAEFFNFVLLYYYSGWVIDRALAIKMGFMIVLNLGILLLLKKYGLLNNVVIAAAVIVLNFVILWLARLVQKEDLKMFLGPIKTKMGFLWFFD